jgi:hypothetical protein
MLVKVPRSRVTGNHELVDCVADVVREGGLEANTRKVELIEVAHHVLRDISSVARQCVAPLTVSELITKFDNRTQLVLY